MARLDVELLDSWTETGMESLAYDPSAYLSLMEKPDIGHFMDDTLDLESKRLVMEIKWSCLLEESENAQQNQMEKIETEFEDLRNKERELQMNWQIEQESSKAKDDIIKYQDEKIFDFEVKLRNLSCERDTLEMKKRELQEKLESNEDTKQQLQKLAIRFNMLEGAFATKLEEKRLECEKMFYKELEEDKMRWKQSSDEIIYDLIRGYENEIAKNKKEMEEVMNNRFVIELRDESIQTSGLDENLDLLQLQHAIEELEREKSILSLNHSNELNDLKTKLEEEINMKKEEYLQESARKEEQLRKTVYDYEERIYELQEKSTNSSENIETPRMSIGVQSCLSESGSFYEDDNPEQLTIQSIDAIKLMADVEENVKQQFANQVKELEEELRKKQEKIDQLSGCQNQSSQGTGMDNSSGGKIIIEEAVITNKVSQPCVASPDNLPDEHLLEGEGERSLLCAHFPKLVRLQSVQDSARAELRRQDIAITAHQENQYLVEKIKHLESLVDEMVVANQDVLDESVKKADDLKLRIENLEQQLRAEKKFVDEQAAEREGEREEFTLKIEQLEEILKRKEKEEDSKISLGCLKEYSAEVSEDEELVENKSSDETQENIKDYQEQHFQKELVDLKLKVSHYELLEAAFDEELTSRIKEIANLSDEIVTLKTTLEETINNSKGKVQRTDSSIEFELLHASTKQNLFVGGLVSGEDTVQHDLMTEIQNYDDKLKEKDQTIDKLKQGININLHLVHELQNMNEMFNNLKKEQIDVVDSDNLSVKERIRHESFDVPNLNESLEPETMSEFVQIQEIQKLKENIGSLIKENMKPVKKRNFDNLETSLNFEKDMLGKAKDNGNKLTVSKSQLQIQEERTKQAFLENEAAEKETERKLRYSWTEGDCESVENLTEKVKRELELSDHLDQTLLSVSGTGSSGVDECVDDLSQQIVDKLLVRICKDGNNPGNESKTGRSRLQAFLPINDIRQMNPSIEEPIIKRNDSNNTSTNEDHLKKKNIEMKQLEERHKFQLQQEKCHVTELQAAIMQERQQSLNVMEKLNSEKESKTELEEEIFSLREEIGDLQTQLMRHRDEIEELSSLYEAEKLQTCVLEEALQEEKENFKRITSSLDEERQRSREVSMRDSDTIIDLRTALEVKKENESRLGLDSPLFGKKSNNGSKLSLYGSRQSIPGHKSPIFAPGGGKPDNEDKIIDELLEERSRCDRLKECLEIEREKSGRLAETTEAEVQELLEQVRQRDEQVVQAGRRLEVTELEKSQLLRELENYKEKLNIQISENKDLVDKQNKMKTPENGKVCSDAFYIEDLESKLEAYREREEDLQHQIDALKKSRTPAASSVFPIMKSSSFGGSLKNIPQEPQDQAIFFFRKLLRAESYRKALVWQKRYLSLLLSSYQESEILSLGRLARMSGARKMLVADIPRPQGKNVQFRVVVHTIISISRMKFLVKRWKKTKKNVKKAWSQDSGNGKQDSEMSVVHPNRQPTEELEPGVSFIRK